MEPYRHVKVIITPERIRPDIFYLLYFTMLYSEPSLFCCSDGLGTKAIGAIKHFFQSETEAFCSPLALQCSSGLLTCSLKIDCFHLYFDTFEYTTVLSCAVQLVLWLIRTDTYVAGHLGAHGPENPKAFCGVG